MRSLLPFLTACGGPEPVEVHGLTALAHDVDLETSGGIARFRVHRAFRSDGTFELAQTFALPTGGAVDAFRFSVDGQSLDGQLLEAEAAEHRYQILSGLAGEDHSTETFLPPALLAWEDRGSVHLSAHPIPPGALIEVDYAVTAPLCLRDGVPVADYPINPELPVSLRSPGTQRELSAGETFPCDPDISSEGERMAIELEPLEAITLRYSAQAIGDEHLLRFALDAPAEIEPIPTGASIVFVMDASISQGDRGLADQAAWAKAYLAWVPDASVEVVAFDRFAERLFERFVPAADFAASFAALAPDRLEGRNGSNGDLGIALALDSLRSTGGPKRIVVTSDLLFRTTFDAASLEAELAAFDGVLHLLRREPEDGSPYVAEREDDRLAPIARATGGLLADLSGDALAEAAVTVVEELVHPLAFESLSVVGMEEQVYLADVERGATSRAYQAITGHAPASVEVLGRVWSRQVRLEASRDRSLDDAMPAFVIGSQALLDEDRVRALAELGGVVSPYTSYLAESGGAPPREPPDTIGGFGGIGYGGSWRCGCCGGISSVGVVESFGSDWLADAMRAAAMSCGVVEAEVVVETSEDEIVDVRVGGDPNAECLTEAGWELRLPEGFGMTRAIRTFAFTVRSEG
jgi:hypothetical protein